MTEYIDVDEAAGANSADKVVEPEDYAHAVLRLSGLPRHEYDRCRKEEASRLDVRVGTLDDEVEAVRKSAENDSRPGSGQDLKLPEPEPWPKRVDGAELLDDIVAEFRRYLILPSHAAIALALWGIHTHALDAAYITPRLTITSPLPRCGKSTVLFILWPLTVRPLHAANLTAPTVFRTVDMAQPTLLIDEADTFLDDQGELAGVLNSGHCRDGAIVIRLVGDSHEPKTFSTWTPCAIAKIGKLTGALADRAIEIQMRRKHRNEIVQQFRRDRSGDLKVLGRKAARWAADNLEVLRAADPDVPDMLNDRQSDNWRTLLAIADLAGGSWPAKAREAAKVLSGSADDGEDLLKVRLLMDIRETFDARGIDRISAADLCQALADIEESPWSSYGRSNKPLTTAQLARQLKPFGVKSKQIRFQDGGNLRGYERDGFSDIFERYIPLSSQDTPSQSATPLQLKQTAGLSPIPKRYNEEDVALQKPPKPADSLACSGVALSQGGLGEEDLGSEVPATGSNNQKPPGNQDKLEITAEIGVPDGEDVEREAIQHFDGQPSRPVAADVSNENGDISESKLEPQDGPSPSLWEAEI